MDKEPNEKKHKRPKNRTLGTINSEVSKVADNINNNESSLESRCPLLAKDSEWVDILQTPSCTTKSTRNYVEEVESENGPQIKPLALMFPGLLEKDPATLEDMLNRAISTTEVTKHLVGQKANFAFMKKVNRLIPSDKKWLESLTENSTSSCSMESKSQKNQWVPVSDIPPSHNGLSNYDSEATASGDELDALENKDTVKQ